MPHFLKFQYTATWTMSSVIFRITALTCCQSLSSLGSSAVLLYRVNVTIKYCISLGFSCVSRSKSQCKQVLSWFHLHSKCDLIVVFIAQNSYKIVRGLGTLRPFLVAFAKLAVAEAARKISHQLCAHDNELRFGLRLCMNNNNNNNTRLTASFPGQPG